MKKRDKSHRGNRCKKKKDNSRVEGAMETKQWAKVQKPGRVEGRRAISALDCGD